MFGCGHLTGNKLKSESTIIQSESVIRDTFAFSEIHTPTFQDLINMLDRSP